MIKVNMHVKAPLGPQRISGGWGLVGLGVGQASSCDELLDALDDAVLLELGAIVARKAPLSCWPLVAPEAAIAADVELLRDHQDASREVLAGDVELLIGWWVHEVVPDRPPAQDVPDGSGMLTW